MKTTLAAKQQSSLTDVAEARADTAGVTTTKSRKERISDAVGFMMSTIWLAFLAFPILEILNSERSVGTKAIFLALIAAFTAAYLWGTISSLRRPTPFSGTLYPTAAIMVTVCLLLTVIATYISPSGIGLGLYLVALVVLTLPPRIGYPLGALIVARIVAAVWVVDDGSLWGLAIIAGGIYGSTLGSTYFSRRAEEDKVTARREAVIEERERIARDVHDVLGHTLTVISLKSDLAARLIDAAPEKARAEILGINELSRQAIADVRTTVSGLSSRQLATEIATIREVAENLPLELTVIGEPEDADPSHRILFGWAAREAFTNVVRHAQARHVTIMIEPHRVAVSDDGVGIDAEEGNGLRGLRRRVEEGGGQLNVASQPGEGTTVEVRI